MVRTHGRVNFGYINTSKPTNLQFNLWIIDFVVILYYCSSNIVNRNSCTICDIRLKSIIINKFSSYKSSILIHLFQSHFRWLSNINIIDIITKRATTTKAITNQQKVGFHHLTIIKFSSVQNMRPLIFLSSIFCLLCHYHLSTTFLFGCRSSSCKCNGFMFACVRVCTSIDRGRIFNPWLLLNH